MSNPKLQIQISNEDLLCKSCREFYGNPQWHSLCSKCYRESSHFSDHHHYPSKNFLSPLENSSLVSPSKATTTTTNWHGFGFDKFLEKKSSQQHTGGGRRSSTLKSLLKKSPSSDCTQNPPDTSSFFDRASSVKTLNFGSSGGPKKFNFSLKRQLSDESLKVKKDFLTFARSLPGPAGQLVTKETKILVEKIWSACSRSNDQDDVIEQISVEELSEWVQQNYQKIEVNLRILQENGASFNHSVEEILDQVELYVCSMCYNSLFCNNINEEVADLSLQERIRSLHWVTYGFLDSGIKLEDHSIREIFDNAVTEIIDMNSRRDPESKLQCVLKCSRLLFESLQKSRSNDRCETGGGGKNENLSPPAAASADEFLPALIFAVLKSNPPLLQSNLNFVSRFARPVKLMSGEAGYYFTNLCCAMNFVQNLNADSLKMPKEEFEAYTSGITNPPLSAQYGSGGKCQEALICLEANLQEVKALKARAEKLDRDLDESRERNCRRWDELIEKVQNLNNDLDDHDLVGNSTVNDLLLIENDRQDTILPEPLRPTVAEE